MLMPGTSKKNTPVETGLINRVRSSFITDWAADPDQLLERGLFRNCLSNSLVASLLRFFAISPPTLRTAVFVYSCVY